MAGVTVNLLLFLTGTLLMYGVVAWALARLPYYARDWFVTKDMYRTVYNGVPALVSGGYWYDLTELMRYGTSLSDILIAPVFGKVAGSYQMLAYFVTTNLVLAVFNLIPCPRWTAITCSTTWCSSGPYSPTCAASRSARCCCSRAY